ncbi:MAG: hypothetical protein WAZ40_03215 [Minisyncoccia bacterium]
MLESPQISTNELAHNPLPENTSARFFDYTEHHREDGVVSAKATSEIVLDAIQNIPGVFFEDVGGLYPLIEGRVLVRRENIETAMHGLLEDKDISIDPKGLYPNVAWWDMAHGSEGLKNAFLEGRAHLNGVVAVLGFEPSATLAIVDQKDIPDEAGVFQGADGADLDRRFVASAHGVVSHNDFRFAIFRFPYQYFPEDKMTDAEIEGGDKNPQGKLQFIFRGVYLPKETERTVH